MKTILTLTITAIKMFVRNRQSLFFSLFMPFVIMLVFGLINIEAPINVKISLVADNPTVVTQQFIDSLDQIDTFTVFHGVEAEERSALEQGDRDIVLLVPADLMPTSGDGPYETKTLTAITNNSQPTQVQTGLTILNEILNKTTLVATQTPTLFELKQEAVAAVGFRYIDFLLPGVVAIAVMQMAVFSVAFVFVDYKEKGILKRLIATPMKPYQFVTANVFTRLLVALAQTMILIFVGIWLFHVHIIGSWFLILPIAILGGIMFLGLGFTISGIAKTVDSVPAIANLIVFPMLFLGGTFFPVDNFPNWLQHIVHYMPLTYFTTSLRAVMTKGAELGSVYPDLLWMAGWAVVLVALAIYTFRFEEKRI
ncbi:MAG: ABC transporter permease [Patescibacteria group bacterium]